MQRWCRYTAAALQSPIVPARGVGPLEFGWRYAEDPGRGSWADPAAPALDRGADGRSAARIGNLYKKPAFL